MERNWRDSNFYRYYVEKAELSDEVFEELEPYVSFKEVSHHQYLLQEGEVSRYSFIVESGLLQSFTLEDKWGELIQPFAPENWIVSHRANQDLIKPASFYI